MKRRQIIVDTDIGSDIDDAIALALAVRSPELELLGVTTVYRSCEKRARIAKALLEEFQQCHIPVYAGIDLPERQDPESIEPEFVKQRYDESGRYIPPQYDADMDVFEPDPGSAVDFIIERCLSNPGRVQLLAIGPLTNLAAAVRKAPELAKAVAGVTLMGGYFTEQIPEWNILCDPEAAKTVFGSGIPIRAVGLDVTLRCELTDAQLAEFKARQHASGSIMARMLAGWFGYYRFSHPVLHDPLAAASLFSDCVTFEKKKVRVETSGKLRGMILPDEQGAEVWAATEVDRERFFELYQNRIFR